MRPEKFIYKLLGIPTGEKEISAFESWIVRWSSGNLPSYGGPYATMTPEAEIFPTQEAAKEFAASLNRSWELLKCKGHKVVVEKNSNVLHETVK